MKLTALKSASKEVPTAKRVELWPGKAPLAPTKRIVFHILNGVVFIDPEHVVYLEAASNYTRIFRKDGKMVMISKTLKYCAGKFPSAFIRIHQSYLINPDFLSAYQTAVQQVILNDLVTLHVSRSGKAAMRAFLAEQ